MNIYIGDKVKAALAKQDDEVFEERVHTPDPTRKLFRWAMIAWLLFFVVANLVGCEKGCYSTPDEQNEYQRIYCN